MNRPTSTLPPLTDGYEHIIGNAYHWITRRQETARRDTVVNQERVALIAARRESGAK